MSGRMLMLASLNPYLLTAGYQDGVTKLVIRPTAKDIAHAVNRVLDDEDLRWRVGSRAVEYVRAHHSRELWEERWREVLAQHV